jgi:type II secretory pathway pseudopilin PulG
MDNMPLPIRYRTVAFTLVELLVVIGAVAVLAAIILPAVTQAKRRAATTECASNLHQLQLAFYQYAQDNDQKVPPYFSNILLYKYPESSGNLVRSVTPYARSAKIWFCPADPFAGTLVLDAGGVTHLYTRYGTNPAMSAWTTSLRGKGIHIVTIAKGYEGITTAGRLWWVVSVAGGFVSMLLFQAAAEIQRWFGWNLYRVEHVFGWPHLQDDLFVGGIICLASETGTRLATSRPRRWVAGSVAAMIAGVWIGGVGANLVMGLIDTAALATCFGAAYWGLKRVLGNTDHAWIVDFMVGAAAMTAAILTYLSSDSGTRDGPIGIVFAVAFAAIVSAIHWVLKWVIVRLAGRIADKCALSR